MKRIWQENKNFVVGELVHTTKEYISDASPPATVMKQLFDKIPVKIFGIVVKPNQGYWGEYETEPTKVLWSSGQQELVWHYEIEKTEK